MKYINKILSVACLGALAFACTDEDTFPYDRDEVLSNQGSYVRLDEIISGEFDVNDIDSSSFSVELTVWGAEQGALLKDLELTVAFIDNTPDTIKYPDNDGINNVAAVPLGTFQASSFTTDAETKLPNITLMIPATEVISALGLTDADLDAGDVFEDGDIFRFEWTMNLTNGNRFNRHNQSNSLSAWSFYNSPFLLDVDLVCLYPDDFATGSYTMTQREGDTTAFHPGEVTLKKGETSTERTFTFTWIDSESTMAFNLVCGSTEVSDNAKANDDDDRCDYTVLWKTDKLSGSGTFDEADDTEITIRFWDDFNKVCDSTTTVITELLLVKK